MTRRQHHAFGGRLAAPMCHVFKGMKDLRIGCTNHLHIDVATASSAQGLG